MKRFYIACLLVFAGLLGFATETGNLPCLYINVFTPGTSEFDNEIIDKDLNHKEYFEGEYWLDTNGCQWMEDLGAENLGSEESPLPLQIKARGNYTMVSFSKKSFKIKLGKKQNMLGLSKSKHFALMAHADDNKGFLRNFIGFNLGRRIGLPWTPSQQPLELFINGDYRGLYFLTESIRVEENRVNITELADNESDFKIISGGYIVELDNYDAPEDSQIQIPEKYCAGKWHNPYFRVSFKEPEVYSPVQREFITEQFNAINDATEICNVDDRLWSYVDLDDAARYYLVREIMSDTESYVQSTYLFRDRGEGRKWHFSPLWDFGQSFNCPSNSLFLLHAKMGTTWLLSWMQNEKFMDKVRETWVWFMQNRFAGIEDDITEISERIAGAAKRDAERWKDAPLPNYRYAEPVKDNSDMAAHSEWVKNYIGEKTDWLKSQYGDYLSLPLAEEPDRDDTPAAPLPQYIITGIDTLEGELRPDGTEELFNLQGQKISVPRTNGIYILTKPGQRSRKVLYRQ